MKQVLSIEQMKHLQELGLDTSDASMCVEWRESDESKKVVTSLDADTYYDYYHETYTLQDILDKLPESIQIYDLYRFKQAGLWYFEYIDVIEDEVFHSEILLRIMDAAYYMLCWCIEKGYIKVDKEVKDGRKEN
jgi:hypothetical protein